MALVRVWALATLDPPVHVLHSFYMNLPAATSDTRLILSASAPATWGEGWGGRTVVAASLLWGRGGRTKTGPRTPRAPPSAAWGQFAWGDFPSPACCFRSRVLHASPCEVQFARLATDPGLLTRWHCWSGRSARSYSGLPPRRKEKLLFLWVFWGLESSPLFLSTCVRIWAVYSSKASLAASQTCFLFCFLLFYHIPTHVPKIVSHINGIFRRSKYRCDFWRGAATGSFKSLKCVSSAQLSDRETERTEPKRLSGLGATAIKG